MPPTCHLSPSEPHRNLIGTSSESRRMISVSSSNYQRYLNSSLFIILPLRSTVSRLAYPDSPTPRLTLEYSARNSMSIIQRGPRKRSWRYGVLLNCRANSPDFNYSEFATIRNNARLILCQICTIFVVKYIKMHFLPPKSCMFQKKTLTLHAKFEKKEIKLCVCTILH